MNNTTGEDVVTITFKGEISLEKKVSFKKAIEVAHFLAEDGEGVSPSTASTSSSFRPAQPILKIGTSALDVIKNSGAKTFPQQILALAHFVTKRDNNEIFDPKDVQLLLRRMGNPPQNFGRDLIKATDVLGYLAKEARGQYIVTETGKEMLKNGFEGSREGSSRNQKIRRKKKKES